MTVSVLDRHPAVKQFDDLPQDTAFIKCASQLVRLGLPRSLILGCGNRPRLTACQTVASSATPKHKVLRSFGHLEVRREPRMQSVINCDNHSVLEDGDMGDAIRVDFRQRWHNAMFVMNKSGKNIEITGPGQACGYLIAASGLEAGQYTGKHLLLALCAWHRADPALARAYFVQAYVAGRCKPTLR